MPNLTMACATTLGSISPRSAKASGGQHHEVTIDFKEVTQLLAAVATAEAVGACDFVFLGWNPLTNLVSEQFHVVRRRDDRAFATVEALLDVAQLWLLASAGDCCALPPDRRGAVR